MRRVLAAAWTALLLVVGVPLAASASTVPTGSAADDATEAVVLVGVPGLAWTDVDAATTPWLERVAEEGAVASMTVRAVRSRSCAVDGWLTLGSGRRAADVAVAPCRVPGPVGSDGRVPAWDEYVAAARGESYGARPGTLASSLEAAGSCIRAVGPGAAIAAADPSGRVARYSSTLPATLDCPVTVVDGGTLPEEPGARTAALREVDALVEGLVRSVASGTRVVVAGVGDGDSAIRPRVVMRSGPPAGVLTSASTRQPGLVQLQDLTATLVDRFGSPVEGLTGRPVTAEARDGAGAERVAGRQGFEVRAGTLRSVSPQVTGWLAVAFAAWCGVVALLLVRRRDAPLPPALRVAGTAVAAVPVSTFVANLVPWWDAGAPAVAFTGALAVVVAAVTALAVLAERRRPLGGLLVVAAVTLLVLVGDVVTGSGLQLASVFGQNPVVGGRFYGIGNTSYALYGVAVLAVVAVLATTRRGSLRHVLGLPALALIALTAVEAHPSLGADFGGPPGLVLGGLVVLAGAARVRLTWVRAVLAAAAVVVLTAGVAVVDWLRPPASRTHLGEFVQTVIDGGMDDVLGRKIAQNLTNLTSPPLVAIAVAAVVLCVVAWRVGWRPSRAGSLVLRGTAVLALVGFAVNDSGLVIPAFAALALLPLLAATPPASAPADPTTPDRPDEPTHVSVGPGVPGVPGSWRT